MAKLQAPETAGWNAGKNYYARNARVDEIKTDEEIARLFDYSEKMVDEVCRSIQRKKYDKSQPLSVWKDEAGDMVLVDGHTRLAAARKAGLEEVPVVEMEFAGKDEAILYTLERQVIRRNLTSDEILTATELMNKWKSGGGRRKGQSAVELAERLGIGPATVKRAKKVLKEAPAEEIAAIRRGDKTIGEVHKALTKKTTGEAHSIWLPQSNGGSEEPGISKDAVAAAASVPAEQNVSRRELLKAVVALLEKAGEMTAARLVEAEFVTGIT